MFNAPNIDTDKKKGKDKEDKEDEDKSEGTNFQDACKEVNVIFSSDSGFLARWAQKLTLCVIMVIEPAVDTKF